MIARPAVVVLFVDGVEARVDVDEDDVEIEVDAVGQRLIVELLLGDAVEAVHMFAHFVGRRWC